MGSMGSVALPLPLTCALVLQVMMGSMVGSLAETMALASKAGIDPAQVVLHFFITLEPRVE